jgi:protein kinase A
MTSTAPSAHSSAPAASTQQQQQYTQGIGSINSIINPPQQQQHGQDAAAVQAQQFQAAKAQPRQTKGKYSLEDFALQRTLGTGSFGRVHLVQSKHNHRFYAIKVLKKAQVVKMKQVEHTNDERRMLQRVKHPFLITLWGTFQDSKNLYMVMDFVEGGELFSLLRKSQVRTYLCPRIFMHADPIIEIPQPRCKILRCRGHVSPGVLACTTHHLP